MAAPHEKLADSLELLKALQSQGRRVFRSGELSRTHRDRLVKNGFLAEIIRGWVISSAPDGQQGDTTAWFASFWEFCARYCKARFGEGWHLSPEQSLLLHAGHTVIPSQVVVYSPKGTNNTVPLLFGTSLFDLKQPAMPPEGDTETKDGLRLYTVEVALLKVPESFFRNHPAEAQVVLAKADGPGALLRRLLGGGHSTVAGRLAAAFRRVGKSGVADEIVAAMKAAGYGVREADPFGPGRPMAAIPSSAAPIIARLHALWASHRETVEDIFPGPPGIPGDKAAYLKAVDGIYKSDAYHSLSIEGYQVSPELVEQVRRGKWAGNTGDDRPTRDALAAKGYWQAFQKVKGDVEKVLGGADAGKVAADAHRAWYRELFQPFVAAGIIGAEALAGYRDHPVYIRDSKHVPPRWEAVRDAMPELFGLISGEPSPAVRAVLGHWLFGYVHPYPDGNGRVARFLMNVMLASGGYPWTVIRVEDRGRYMDALESASAKDDVEPFAAFIAEQIGRPVSSKDRAE